MGIQNPGVTTNAYYDPTSLQHMGIDHGGSMAHTTRAHPQTVSVCVPCLGMCIQCRVVSLL